MPRGCPIGSSQRSSSPTSLNASITVSTFTSIASLMEKSEQRFWTRSGYSSEWPPPRITSLPKDEYYWTQIGGFIYPMLRLPFCNLLNLINLCCNSNNQMKPKYYEFWMKKMYSTNKFLTDYFPYHPRTPFRPPLMHFHHPSTDYHLNKFCLVRMFIF